MNNSNLLDAQFNQKSSDKNRSVHFNTTEIIIVPPESSQFNSSDEKIPPKIRRKSFGEKSWITHTYQEKLLFIVKTCMKIIIFLSLVYLFLIALNFMNIGFTMVAAYTFKAKKIIRYLLHNPFGSLCIGVMVTALLQNATASTSIIISLVAANIIPDVKSAIPLIMGSNIGTCVTNAFISLTLAHQPNQFKRAFTAAALNDIFNFLTTFVLLTIEIASGFLFYISLKITKLLPFENIEVMSKINILSSIINPVCDLFIRLDPYAVNELIHGKEIYDLSLRCCQFNNEKNNNSNYANETNQLCLRECTYWCIPMLKLLGEGGTGLFWIILSIIVIIGCLIAITNVLSLMITGPIAKSFRISINYSFSGRLKWMSQFILFSMALLMTVIVQNSNIVTATLIPLCGVGIITLERVYVMTLGANLGTTITGLLTAFSTPPESLEKSHQLALIYTFFNLFGVILWLPIPFFHKLPKKIARRLGNAVFEYRWLVYAYVLFVYFIGPLLVFSLAMIPYWIGLMLLGIPIAIFGFFFCVLKWLQTKFPRFLPDILKSFDWLPLWMRSLKPLDKKLKQLKCCKRKRRLKTENSLDSEGSLQNSDSEGKMPFANLMRRFSVMEGLVDEGLNFARDQTLSNLNSIDEYGCLNSIIIENEESSEEEHESEAVKKYKEGKQRMSINPGFKTSEINQENLSRRTSRFSVSLSKRNSLFTDGLNRKLRQNSVFPGFGGTYGKNLYI